MYLKRLIIRNFRSIKDLTVDFCKGVNVLIGENNSGKSTVLDALRNCLSYGKQSRDIFISLNDFHIDKNDPNRELGDIEFHLYLEFEKPEEAGLYVDLLSVNEGGRQEGQLHIRCYVEEKRGPMRVRYKVWGGDNEGQLVSPEVLDLIYFVHLGALRDAVQNLRPARGSRLGELYTNLVTDNTRQEILVSKVRTSLHEDEEWRDVINDGKAKINEHLKDTSFRGKEQRVEIDFLPFEFRKLVDNLRIQMPVFEDDVLENEKKKQRYLELNQNGLGYNNLIYIAAVLGDLKRRKELDDEQYVSLLVEEPEAHLHPQLQNLFFSYLNDLNKIGFQIFITSHSPTITAKANLDSLIVFREDRNEISALAISSSSLDASNKKYLMKFLDVTKSQLFFANGVILVEGISEALLLPIFSKIMGDEYDIEKRGIELVNINGLAFEHFAKLFNSDDVRRRLSCRCAILTDDDRKNGEESSSRAANAKSLEGGLLKVELSAKTFEHELFKTGSNRNLLLEIFTEMHKVAAKKMKVGASLDEQADNFLEKVESSKAKSELAHRLAVRLENDCQQRKSFTVPKYIKSAIEWVTKGE